MGRKKREPWNLQLNIWLVKIVLQLFQFVVLLKEKSLLNSGTLLLEKLLVAASMTLKNGKTDEILGKKTKITAYLKLWCIFFFPWRLEQGFICPVSICYFVKFCSFVSDLI